MAVVFCGKAQEVDPEAERGISIDGIDDMWMRWRALDDKVRRVFGGRGRVYRMGDKWAWFRTDKPWDLDGVEVTQRPDGFWAAVLLRNGRAWGKPFVGIRLEEVLGRTRWRELAG